MMKLGEMEYLSFRKQFLLFFSLFRGLFLDFEELRILFDFCKKDIGNVC